MIYCFNDSLGFASSGIEYAQAYRAKLFRKLGMPAKFVYTGIMRDENIQSYSENIGFLDSEIIWLYGFFTDIEVCPYQVRISEKSESLKKDSISVIEKDDCIRYIYAGKSYAEVHLIERESELYIKTIEYGYEEKAVRLDHYTSCLTYTEDYALQDGRPYICKRRFFNKNGNTAFEIILAENKPDTYIFPDRTLYSLNELIGYMLTKLNLTEDDYIIIDRDRDNAYGRALIENKGKAKLGTILHAEHSFSDAELKNVIWNKNYEYRFKWNKYFDFYIVSTKLQAELLEAEIRKTYGIRANIYVIPVGSIDRIRKPIENRKPYSLITASRIAVEKRLDVVIEAVIRAHDELPELTLDIYGKGGQQKALEQLIATNSAEKYIFFKGQQKLDEIYKSYEAYISGSYSEGFGLTLLEACGSGLPIVGFDVRYGNKEFVTDGKNGVLAPFESEKNREANITALADAIIELFNSGKLEDLSNEAYNKACDYLEEEIENKWIKCLHQS